MDNLTARIEELNWVQKRMSKIFMTNSDGSYADDDADELDAWITGRLLALENEAIAKEVTNNGGR